MLDFSVTFIITLLNIAFLFFILRLVLFKPVTKFMDERAKKVQDARDQAEKDKNQAGALLAQYQEQLKKAEEAGAEIVRAARETAQEEADRIIAEGKAEAAKLLDRARRQTAAEEAAAMMVFKAEAAALVLAAASRLMRREFANDDVREQAALLLQELGNRNVPG